MAFLYTNNGLPERKTKEKSFLLQQQQKKNILKHKFNQGGKRPVLGKL